MPVLPPSSGRTASQSLAREDGARFSEQVYVALRRAGWLVSPVLEGEKRLGGTETPHPWY